MWLNALAMGVMGRSSSGRPEAPAGWRNDAAREERAAMAMAGRCCNSTGSPAADRSSTVWREGGALWGVVMSAASPTSTSDSSDGASRPVSLPRNHRSDNTRGCSPSDDALVSSTELM